MSRSVISGRQVLVTGVTAGLGRSLARQLRERGCHVIGTCRDDAQASALVTDGICDDTVRVDLALAETVQSIPAQLSRLGIESLDAVMHCAAITGAAPIETMAMDQARAIIEVNVFGTLGLIQATADLLRRTRGRLIITGSVAGFSVWPMLGVYGVTKHAMEALADAARRELAPWGIKVSLIRPGGIQSRMLSRHLEEMRLRLASLQGVDLERYGRLYKTYTDTLSKGGSVALTPDAMAAKLLRVLESRHPKPSYCFGIDSKLLRAIDLLLPDSAFDYLVGKLFPA